jgi:hypothetical protein
MYRSGSMGYIREIPEPTMRQSSFSSAVQSPHVEIQCFTDVAANPDRLSLSADASSFDPE